MQRCCDLTHSAQRPLERCAAQRAAHGPSLRLRKHCRSQRSKIAAESSKTEPRQEESEEAMSDKMADFLREQAEKESGGRVAVADEAPKQVIGRSVVSDEDAKKFCRDIMAGVRQLREKRDMSINEVKLTVAIEDPTDRERKAYLGVELVDINARMEKPLIVANLGRSSSVVQEGEGVSRDDIAAALMEVVAGRIPLDRIALKELAREVKDWPYLDAEEQLAQQDAESEANYEGIINTEKIREREEQVSRGKDTL